MRTLMLAGMTMAATGIAAGAEFDTAGSVALDSAYGYEVSSLQKAEAAVEGMLSLQLADRWRVVGEMRARFDTQEELEPGEPDQHERSSYNRRWLLGERGDVELREFYLDGSVGDLNLRIGKQQIAWGQADGVRVLDLVNPYDFREFILPKPEDRRTALWTVNAELPVASGSLQFLWLPDPTYDEIPLGEAAFAVTTPLLLPRAPAGVPVQVRETLRPEGFIDSSDAGLRWSAFAGGWDLTLNYLYHYYDDPVPFVSVTNSGVVVEPRYERSQMTGGSASNAFGSTTLRAEVAWSTDRWFVTNDSIDPDRVFSSDEFAWVVGIDNTALNDTLLSMQYHQSTLDDCRAGSTRDCTERQVTLLVQRSFANEAVQWRTLWLTSLNRQDGALQMQVAWQWRSSLRAALRVEHFYGDRNGLFGEFRDAARVGLNIEWAP